MSYANGPRVCMHAHCFYLDLQVIISTEGIFRSELSRKI